MFFPSNLILAEIEGCFLLFTPSVPFTPDTKIFIKIGPNVKINQKNVGV